MSIASRTTPAQVDNLPSLAPAAEAASTFAVRRELLASLVRQSTGIILGNALVTCAVVYALWSPASKYLMLGWASIVFGVTAIRFALVLHIKRALPAIDDDGLSRLERAFIVLAMMSGMLWGGLAWITYRGEEPFSDFFVAAMVVGMTGGAVAPLSLCPPAFHLYAIAAVVPFVVKSAFIDGPVHLAGGLTALFCVLVLMIYSRTITATARGAIALRMQNEALVRQLQQEKAAIEAATRAKQLFLAGVSHDMRQPVHALTLFDEYLVALARDLPAPHATRLAEVAEKIGITLSGMQSLLSRLLELARLESGEVQADMRPVALQTILDRCLVPLAPKAQERSIRVSMVPTRAWVLADEALLQSIVDNIAHNAVEHARGGRVLVGVRRRASRVNLHILDTGPGIASDRLETVFEPYRRFDDRTRGADSGYGLGLALVKLQADLMTFEVDVHSKVGRGTRVCVSMPKAFQCSRGLQREIGITR